MTSRARWLLVVGLLLICAAFGLRFLPPKQPALSARAIPHRIAHPRPRALPRYQPPFSEGQLNAFLASARKAEAIAEPLQRCLSYPNPPGLNWSTAVTSAYCHYQFDPAVTPEEARRLIQTGHAAELDRRLAAAMHAQLSQPDQQGLLDRTYMIDFRNGSEETRGLMDAWKRQSPDSPFALAASGTAYVQMAQEARGSKYAAKTPQSSFDAMQRLLRFARDDLDRAVQIEPKLTAAYAGMIYLAALDGDWNYANDAARRALAADPANYTIYARLVWMAQPKWGGTVAVMQHLIADAQRHAGANPLLKLLLSENSGGEAYVEDCACDRAGEFRLYQQVFAEASTVNMLMSAGWAAKNRNSVDLSVIYRSELLRFAPDKLDYREIRATDLAALGQLDWALAEGNALVKMAPQDENAFYARGVAYESTGNIARAIDDYEQALRLDPEDTWTLSRVGALYVHSTHQWDKGWATANRLIQLDPNHPQGWLLRASIQEQQPRPGLDDTVKELTARFGNTLPTKGR